MPRIITFTINPSIDISLQIDRIVPDRKLRGGSLEREPGGGGINVSRALAHLGKQSHALFVRGGETGAILAGLLEKERVSCVPIPVSGLTRENFMMRETISGLLYRVVLPGPELTKKEVESCYGRIAELAGKDDFLVLSGSVPPGVGDDFYANVAERVRSRGTACIVDTSGAPLRKAAQSGVFLLKPNMRELAQLYGREIPDEETQVRAAASMVGEGRCDIIVVSLGSAGALLVTSDIRLRLRSPVVPIVSKVGAGDSMVAGIVYGLSEGYSIKRAVQYGIAAGAAAVMTPGTKLCGKEDTDRLFSELTA